MLEEESGQYDNAATMSRGVGYAEIPSSRTLMIYRLLWFLPQVRVAPG
jgi:hypothetical protein